MKQTTMNADCSAKNRQWYHVNADSQVLGRLATQIVDLLRGCHKPSYLPYKDCGDYVVVTNCSKINLTGNKWTQKKYYRHSGYIGNLKVTNAKTLHQKKPTELIYQAVKNMLQQNKLANQQIKKLFLYANESHAKTGKKLVEFKVK